MTLQPLVENAIYHGLKYKENWGTIEITGKVLSDEDKAVIMVRDDGIGMEEQRLKEMQDTLESGEILEDEDKKHFGVYSVDHRMRLYYGDEYGITVDSTYGEGSTVTVSIPLTQNKA
jgi:two-component system sensor histidine kinase YesM